MDELFFSDAELNTFDKSRTAHKRNDKLAKDKNKFEKRLKSAKAIKPKKFDMSRVKRLSDLEEDG